MLLKLRDIRHTAVKSNSLLNLNQKQITPVIVTRSGKNRHYVRA